MPGFNAAVFTVLPVIAHRPLPLAVKLMLDAGIMRYTYYNDFTSTILLQIRTAKASFGGSARYGAVGFSIGTKGYIGLGQGRVVT